MAQWTDGPGGLARGAPGARDDHGLRQPRVHRAPDALRAARRLPVRPRAAGGRGRRHGRRLRPGQRPPGPGQPAHRARRRQRDRRPGERRRQRRAARGHGRAAGPADDEPRGAAHEPGRDDAAAAHGQALPRAGPPGRRPRRAGPRDPRRRPARRGARCSCRSRWTTGTPCSTRRPRRPASSRGAVSTSARPRTPRVSTSSPRPSTPRAPRRWCSGVTSTPPAASTTPWRSPNGSAPPCSPRPSRAASASPPTIPSSRAPCRWRSPRSRRPSSPSTSCWSSARRCSATTPTCPGPSCPRAHGCCTSPPTPTRPPAPRWATRSSPTPPSRCGRCSSASARDRPTGRRRRSARALDGAEPRRRGSALGRGALRHPRRGVAGRRGAGQRGAVAPGGPAGAPADQPSGQLVLHGLGRARLRAPGRGRAWRSPTRRARWWPRSATARCSTRSSRSPPPRRWQVPVTIIVLDNREYAILKWFAQREQTPKVPGLDLPAIDHLALAQGYGVPAETVVDGRGVPGRGAPGRRRSGAAPRPRPGAARRRADLVHLTSTFLEVAR